MLSEFRDAGGALGAFEISPRFATAGALRTALARLPGIHFEATRGSLWSAGLHRFTFRDRAYQISVAFEHVRVAPAQRGAVYPETEELLRLVWDNLVPKWQHRARSRF
jgi:hypothetical protein